MTLLEVLRAQLGQGEQERDNGGPVIALYFGRDHKPGTDYGNWCAALQSWAAISARYFRPHDLQPNERRGAKAFCRAVGNRGSYLAKPSAVLSAKCSGIPRPEDIIAWHRGSQGSWWGHVACVESYDPATDTLVVIDGNSSRFPSHVRRRTLPNGEWRRRLYAIARWR